MNGSFPFFSLRNLAAGGVVALVVEIFENRGKTKSLLGTCGVGGISKARLEQKTEIRERRRSHTQIDTYVIFFI